jgi:putative pyoverdin transport system ATP-binding/permease protein
VVITHDDRYFHLGDRVVKLEEGQIVSTEPATTLNDRSDPHIAAVAR